MKRTLKAGALGMGLLALAVLMGCGGKGGSAASGEPVVIRVAHDWPRVRDTSFRDPITGEPARGQEEMSAMIYAEQQVLEKLNVKFEWLAYPGVLEEDILRSVLAGDPLAELVRVIRYHGTVLGQNVLQPLDEYESLFQDEDSAWIFLGKVYGHNYFLAENLRYGTEYPLCYNIGMLEKVDALKVNGKLVLPAQLWKEGKWTWSVFEDYLQKVYDYWSQKEDFRMAYDANYPVAALMAMHSNGAAFYGDNGLEINTAEAKEAVAYIERLMSKNLIRNIDIVPGTSEMRNLMDNWRLQWGHAVFANLQQWLAGDMVGPFNQRGETMGIVPFPRPDSMAADDPRYHQLKDVMDCFAVPRGVSKEKAALAVKAYREYIVSYYKKMAGSNRALDYLQADGAVRTSALKMFLDITNEDYGEDLLDVWKFLASGETKTNEYNIFTGVYELWSRDVLGDALYGVNGASRYSTQVDRMMGRVNEAMSSMQRALGSSQSYDNIAPRFADVEGAKLIFPAGTAPAGIDWGVYLAANDNVDGPLAMTGASVDYAGANFNRPGSYGDGLAFSIKDKAGNEGSVRKTVTIYDGANKTPPKLTIKTEYRKIARDEDSARINWKDDFVDSAKDKDGLDVKGSVTADLSELDTTNAGVYNVTLTVTDYAGNQASAAVKVTVE